MTVCKTLQFLERFGIHPLTDPRFTDVISLLKSNRSNAEEDEQFNDSDRQFPENIELEEFYRYFNFHFHFHFHFHF